MKKFTPCRKCFGKNEMFEQGYIVDKHENGFSAVECECRKKWRNKEKVKIRFSKRGGNIKFIDYDIETDYIEREPDSVKQFVTNYLSGTDRPEVLAALCWFYGDNGTQKSTVSYYILKELLMQGIDSEYILMSKLVKSLMNAERDEEAQQYVEQLKNRQVLIIDEAFDLQKLNVYKSGWQIPFIDTFLRERINTNKGIIFISNILHNDIKQDVFGKSLSDLIDRHITQDKTFVEFKNKFVDSTIQVKGLFD